MKGRELLMDPKDIKIDLKLIARLRESYERVQILKEIRAGMVLAREPDEEAHVIRLLETQMRVHGLGAVLISTATAVDGRAYGKVFEDLKLDVKCYQDKQDDWYWATAKTSDGRLLGVRWPLRYDTGVHS